MYRLDCQRRRPRILLAEDDDAFRRLLALTLRCDGFDVVEVRNGRELVHEVAVNAQSSGRRFDLVITDLRMPAMTGLEAIAGLRGAEWPIPVILITAFGDAATQVEATRLGAAAMFSKPFDLGDLRTAALHLAGA